MSTAMIQCLATGIAASIITVAIMLGIERRRRKHEQSRDAQRGRTR